MAQESLLADVRYASDSSLETALWPTFTDLMIEPSGVQQCKAKLKTENAAFFRDPRLLSKLQLGE